MPAIKERKRGRNAVRPGTGDPLKGTETRRWEIRFAKDRIDLISGGAARRVSLYAPVARSGESAGGPALQGGRRTALDWRGEALVSVAEAAGRLGNSVEFSYRLTRGSLRQAGGVAALAVWCSRHERSPIRLRLVMGSSISFSDLSGLPEALAGSVYDRSIFHSEAGLPMCVFATAVSERLFGLTAVLTDAAYGPECGGCILSDVCSGVSASYAARFGFKELRPLRARRGVKGGSRGGDTFALIPWEDRVRWLLVDRPALRIGVTDVLGDGLPEIRCVRPWVLFEMHENGSYGPCCCNYMRVPAPPFPDGADLDRLWNSGVFRTFRKAMLAGERPRTCRDTCPALAGGTDRLDRMTIKGGPAALVENQIRCIRAMIEGRVEVAHAPTRVNVAATTFCNYDCLMCDCGRKGTLKDQRTPEFYRKLKPWIGGAELIEASGGEPLASPNYRKFVAGMAASDLPANLLVTTNGSLLTPAWLATLPRIPFALICISLNAATAGTYLAVNRGATWKTIRRNIDELLRLRRGGRFNGAILYSMVILRRNLHEIRAFAEMAVRDGVNVRYHLPNRDLNGQTIMTDEGSMIRAADALEEAAGLLDAHAMTWSADEVRSRLTVLRNRLAAGIFEPI